MSQPYQQQYAQQPYSSGPPTQSHSGGKTALIVVGALFLLGVLGIGGLVLIGSLAGDDESADSGDIAEFCALVEEADSTSQDERATQEHRDFLDGIVVAAPAEIREEAARVIAAQQQLSESAEFDEPVDPEDAIALQEGFIDDGNRFRDFIDDKC